MTDADIRHCRGVHIACDLWGEDRVIPVLVEESLKGKREGRAQAGAAIVKARLMGRPSICDPPSIDRAFMVGNECSPLARRSAPTLRGGGSSWGRQASRCGRPDATWYLLNWAGEHPEGLALLLHMKQPPSYLMAPKIANISVHCDFGKPA